ncbi:hypothetical protein LSCM4_08232 [Leishmania orientalis]|uniref:Uncharacterized protein n=1 Tax=Leishmania orientalis TaxID=2249476 RepID=A0A836I4X8_9TRYP|nr:hypothetical protein LSCM4_08232 [Leishmania orientalis]
MVVHLSVVQEGAEGSCDTSGDTDRSIAGLDDVRKPCGRCRSPSPATVVKDKDSNDSKSRDRRRSSTDAAENAVATLERSERVSSRSTAPSTPVSPLSTFAAVGALPGTVAAEADQRVGSVGSGAISTASSSRQPALLWEHASVTGSAPQDAGLYLIPVSATAPLTWWGHSRSLSDPSLRLAVASSGLAGAVAMPTSDGATAAVHSTPAASAPLHVGDQVPPPGGSASPLRDSTSSRNSAGASVTRLARFGESPAPTSPVSMVSLPTATPILASAAAAATPAVPPHSLAALLVLGVPDSSPPFLPAVTPPSSSAPTLVSAPTAYPRCLQAPSPPSMAHHQRQQAPFSARMTTPVAVVKGGEGLREDLADDLLSCHGGPHVPLGHQKHSAGCFSASGRLSSALYSSLFSVCGGGTGNLSTFGSPATAGLPAQPSSPSLLSGASPPSKPRLLEARVLAAGTSPTQPFGRPPVSLPPIPSAGATASSPSSLSLLSPPSAVLGSFSSDSSRNNRSGGGGFQSPLTFRSPFASVLTPQAHYHHPATMSPHPCFFYQHTPLPPTTPPPQQQQPPAQQLLLPLVCSPPCASTASIPSLLSSFFSAPSPPTAALSAVAAGHGPPAASSSLSMQRGGSVVVTTVSPASAHNATGSSPAAVCCTLHVNSPPELMSPAKVSYSASPPSATTPWSSRSLVDGAGQAPRSPLALMVSMLRFPSPSRPLPSEATTAAQKEDRGDTLRVSASPQQLVPGTAPPTLASEAGPVEIKARRSSSDTVESRGDSQSQGVQQQYSQQRRHDICHLSLRGVPAQPVVQPEAWRMLEVSGGGSWSGEDCGDGSTHVRGVGREPSASIASPADSATVPQSPRQPREREVSRDVVEVLIAACTGREVDNSEANTSQRKRRTDDTGTEASTGDRSSVEDEAVASKDEHGVRFTMCRCRRGRSGLVAQETAATPTPPVRLLQPMSLHNGNRSNGSPPAHTAEAQEEAVAEERHFSISSILTSAVPRVVGLAPSINGSSGLHFTASVGATAAGLATAAAVTPASHFRLSSFAALSHGKTNTAPEPTATVEAAAGAGAEASRPPAPPPLMPPSSAPPSLLAAPGWGARASGTPAQLGERLSVSSASCTSLLSPTCRKACGRATDSYNQSTCGATQALNTNSTAFFSSQMGASSRSNSSLGGRRRGSPMRGNCRSRRTSSVTIIGVVGDESLALPVRGVTSRAPGPAVAGAEPWSAAAASAPAPPPQATPISSEVVSPLAELLLASPSNSAGSSVLLREGSSCDGDMPTPDMAAAAAAAVLRLHRQRPRFTPLSSTAPMSAPEQRVATKSPEGDAATAGNASTSTGTGATAAAALPAAATMQPKGTSAPSPHEGSKGSSRLLHRTPSSLARAVVVALRRPPLADDPAGGGVRLHNPSPSIPSLLISSAHVCSTTAVAPTAVTHLGETSATPLQRTLAGGSSEADATARPQLQKSTASTEAAVVVNGAATGGTPHLKQPRGGREPPLSEQQQPLSGGCFEHLGSSPNLDDAPLPPGSTADDAN